MSVILGALGMYTLIRPLTSMMMEWKKLKSIELKAAIKKETLFVEEDGMEIKIPLSSLRNIKKKSHYIRFNMNRFQGFSIPDRFFNSEDFRQLQQFLQKKKA
ncbi:YcxB family protein [Persicobacter diffluens]